VILAVKMTRCVSVYRTVGLFAMLAVRQLANQNFGLKQGLK